MQPARFLECLDADATRLRDVASRDLSAPVPSCPEWTAGDLVRHTAHVYLHKVESMRRGAPEGPWPPPGTEDEEAIALFDRAYRELVEEFAARTPTDETPTWFAPDQTVGFWIRRMAQETVIHRIDAELSQSEPRAPVPDDLAVDGVDEILVCFLSYATVGWAEQLSDALSDCDGRAVAISTGGRSWRAQLTNRGVIVTDGDGDAAASVTGSPDAMLTWLWRRGGDETVDRSGDQQVIAKLWQLLGIATE